MKVLGTLCEKSYSEKFLERRCSGFLAAPCLTFTPYFLLGDGGDERKGEGN